MARLQSKNFSLTQCLFCSLTLLICLISGAAAQQKSVWKLARLPFDETITGISFPTVTTGYFVTSGGRYGVTRDGGLNWQSWHIQGATNLEDVYFRTADTGIAVGRNGVVYRTVVPNQHGGVQWEQRHYKDTVTWLTSAVFLNDSIVLATGIRPQASLPGILWRSTDAGKHWDSVAIGGLGFGELFYQRGTPVCFQAFGKLYYSQDLGKTWKSLETINGKPGRATAFYNKTGVICGNSGMLAISSDRGTTWESIKTDDGVNFTSVVLVNDSVGFIAGTNGTIMETVDAGKTWRIEKGIPDPVDIADLAVVGNKIFAVGAGGSIYSRSLK